MLAVSARALLLLCVACLCIGECACVREADACLNYDDGHCDWLAKPRIDGAHFDFNPPLTPSRDFWLSAGDQMKVSWTQFALLYQHRGASCNFDGVTDNNTLNHDNCRLCTYCPWNYCGMLSVFADTSKPTLLPHEAMMSQPSATPIPIDPARDSVCSSNGGFGFIPMSNATYQLKAVDEPAGLTTKLFVVKPGAGQSVSYLLLPLAQPGVTDAVFYSGKVPSAPLTSGSPHITLPSTPVLSDNFNPSLHITKVRVLRAPLLYFPFKGPQLTDGIVVHPSRIVFLPNYQEGNSVYMDPSERYNRCYADADGTIDLTRCRHRYQDESTIDRVNATPTYLTDLDPNKQLVTWVVEFKSSEGGRPQEVAYDSFLAIEFTIEAN